MKQLRIWVLLLAIACLPLLSIKDSQAQTGATSGTTSKMVTATSRANTVDGRAIGEVRIEDRVIMTIRTASGSLTPAQRAEIVAARITSLTNQGYGYQDVHVRLISNTPVVMVGNNQLVSVSAQEARLANTTPLGLAYSWQGNLQTAIRTAVGTTNPDTWPDWTTPANKIVPIFSVGTPGVSLGAAQIVGPAERVNQVQAVFQLDATFQRVARIRAFVPSSSLTGVNRVQGTAVSGLLQYTLFQF